MPNDIQTLTCCCCGNATKGRQWHNRDTGYGLCNDCVAYCARNTSAEEFQSCYGISGIHYNVQS